MSERSCIEQPMTRRADVRERIIPRWQTVSGLVGAILSVSVPTEAQSTGTRAPLMGTVGATAFGAPAPTASPIGGLSGRPLAGSPVGAPRAAGQGRPAVVPLRVLDAPRTRSGFVTTDSPDDVAPRTAWMPTAAAPTWRRDPRVRPVDGWRDLIVTDVVCTIAGACRQREQAVRAAWVARCGCYAFADGWNRLWRVE
jgi:hypothetical protein